MLRPSSPWRKAIDIAWIAAFCGVVAAMALSAPGGHGLADTGGLALEAGHQRQGVYFRGARLATLHSRTLRTDAGWRIATVLERDGRAGAQTRMDLARDLSLTGFRVRASLDAMLEAGGGGLVALALKRLRHKAEVDLHGSCELATGRCHVRGELAGEPLRTTIAAGRGPVLAAALYPLLARGSLGRTAELGLFDPLSMVRRVIAFRVEGGEQLTLGGRTFEAVRVSRDLEGVRTRVWLDRRGRVLREELPLGIELRHESFEAAPPPHHRATGSPQPPPPEVGHERR